MCQVYFNRNYREKLIISFASPQFNIVIHCQNVEYYLYQARIKLLRQKCNPEYFDNLILVLPMRHPRLPVSKAITNLSSPVVDCSDMIMGTSICITVAGNIIYHAGKSGIYIVKWSPFESKELFPDITIPIIIRSWEHLRYSIKKEAPIIWIL